jgi:hypothetical protein
MAANSRVKIFLRLLALLVRQPLLRPLTNDEVRAIIFLLTKKLSIRHNEDGEFYFFKTKKIFPLPSNHASANYLLHFNFSLYKTLDILLITKGQPFLLCLVQVLYKL